MRKVPAQRLSDVPGDQLLLARRLHRGGADLQQVHDALGWDCDVLTTQRRLRKYGLKVRPGNNKQAHDGDETTIPKRA